MKTIYLEIEKCTDCPYFRYDENVTANVCGLVDKVISVCDNYDKEVMEWCELTELEESEIC